MIHIREIVMLAILLYGTVFSLPHVISPFTFSDWVFSTSFLSVTWAIPTTVYYLMYRDYKKEQKAKTNTTNS